jgi:DNA polymerase/3'-5' exonuclease PolX
MNLAVDIRELLLSTVADRADVVGSVRRAGEGGVKDIELVVLPTERDVGNERSWSNDLYTVLERYCLEKHIPLTTYKNEKLTGLNPDGSKKKKRYVNGPRLKRVCMFYAGSRVDVELFIVRPPAQYGLIKLIRTGPWEFSKELVTLVKELDMFVKDGALHKKVGNVVWIAQTPNELDVFRAIGLPKIDPTCRGKRYLKGAWKAAHPVHSKDTT